jgi:hypothetical protein
MCPTLVAPRALTRQADKNAGAAPGAHVFLGKEFQCPTQIQRPGGPTTGKGSGP